MKFLSPLSQKIYQLISAGLASAAVLSASQSTVALAQKGTPVEHAGRAATQIGPVFIAAADIPDDGDSQSGQSQDDPQASDTQSSEAQASGLSPLLITKIASLEAKLFGEQHQGEPAERRVARIEKFVYGNTATGSVAERVQNLETAMLQKNPDGTSAVPLPSAGSVPVIPPAGQPVPVPQVNLQQNSAAQGDAGAASAASADQDRDQQVASSLPSSAASAKTIPRASPGEPLKLSLVKYRDIQQPKRVIQELNEAIDSDPNNNADLLFQRAKAYLELEDYDRALSDLTDAIQKEPMRCQYYLVRACILNKLGKPFQAQKDIVRARFVNPALPQDVQFDKDAGGQ